MPTPLPRGVATSLLILFFSITPLASAQFGPQQVISTDHNHAVLVHTADLDGDGDIDVLANSTDDHKVVWYANDGAGNFGSQQVITPDVQFPRTATTADIDGDGDIDVISGSSWDSKIAWYANDGTGNFGAQQLIATDVADAYKVHTADLDGDNDPDVIVLDGQNDEILWYANDGTGTFGTRQTILTGVDALADVDAADFDGDGDLDLLLARGIGSISGDGLVEYYKNDGTGTFSRADSWNRFQPSAVFAADIDGDGDMDAFSADFATNKVRFYENFNNVVLSNQAEITNNAASVRDVFAVDLDGDGDLDVLSASHQDDKIAWYETTSAAQGAKAFSSEQIITLEADWAVSVTAADLDGDGDADVLSASEVDNKIAWYENMMTPVSNETEDHLPTTVVLDQNYPNPFNPSTAIRYALPQATAVRLTVHDVLGRIVAVLIDAVQPAGYHTANFEAHTLPSGLYLYRLEAGTQQRTGHMTLLR